jgi:hypothetical protein
VNAGAIIYSNAFQGTSRYHVGGYQFPTQSGTISISYSIEVQRWYGWAWLGMGQIVDGTWPESNWFQLVYDGLNASEVYRLRIQNVATPAAETAGDIWFF